MEHVKPLRDILGIMKDRSPLAVDLVGRAYAFAEKAHHGQKRYSGSPYFVHVSAVGYTLAEIGLDAKTIAAGLLHDTIEDAKVSAADIERLFGKEVRDLVDGVTKLGKLKYRGLERHVESLRKLFVSTAKDLRVILIKLADRLHNVSTLKFVPKEKQRRIAIETLEIYAPVADRLSIGRIKGALEDYSFPFALPEEYERTQSIIREKVRESEKRLEKFYRDVQTELGKNGITNVRGEFRVKRTYSLYKKLLRNDWDIDKIHDIMAVRVIVPTTADCYHALGIVHANWRPFPGRIKDYIAFPKPNGYQSLHTTVFTGDGGLVEVQLRTPEMDREAALGIAAHFAYKEGLTKKGPAKAGKQFDWVRELAQMREHAESGEFMSHLKTDFFEDRVFVFTPKGDVIDLPRLASPIDFAYAIHSDIGEHTSGARVNGKMVALDTPLHNGDIVEIITKRSAKPGPKWVEYAKTTMARKHIRTFLQEERVKKVA